MAITPVGSLAVSNGVSTLAVSPTNIGNILVLMGPGVNSANFQTASGGGVTTWTQIWLETNGAISVSGLWGIVTAVGASTITVGTIGGSAADFALACQEFTGGGPGTWSSDGAGGGAIGTAASGNYPSLVPATANELYVAGYCSATFGVGGSTAGFAYANPIGATGNERSGAFVYGVVSAAASPAWTNSSSAFATASWLFKFTPPSPKSGFLSFA